jgi:flagellum-specific ATP synthase
MPVDLETFIANLRDVPSDTVYGRVTSVLGLMVEVSGLEHHLSVGGRVDVIARGNRRVPCEVVGFKNNRAQLMTFGTLDGVGLGCRAEARIATPALHPTPAWLGPGD